VNGRAHGVHHASFLDSELSQRQYTKAEFRASEYIYGFLRREFLPIVPDATSGRGSL